MINPSHHHFWVGAMFTIPKWLVKWHCFTHINFYIFRLCGHFFWGSTGLQGAGVDCGDQLGVVSKVDQACLIDRRHGKHMRNHTQSYHVSYAIKNWDLFFHPVYHNVCVLTMLPSSRSHQRQRRFRWRWSIRQGWSLREAPMILLWRGSQVERTGMDWVNLGENE
jgi:hypothetical protein